MAHPSRRTLLLSGGAAALGAGVFGTAAPATAAPGPAAAGPLIFRPGELGIAGARYDLDTGRVTLVR